MHMHHDVHICMQYFYQLKATWIGRVDFDLEFTDDTGVTYHSYSLPNGPGEPLNAVPNLNNYGSCSWTNIESWTFAHYPGRNDVSASVIPGYLDPPYYYYPDPGCAEVTAVRLVARAWGIEVAGTSCYGSECNGDIIISLDTSDIGFPCGNTPPPVPTQDLPQINIDLPLYLEFE